MSQLLSPSLILGLKYFTLSIGGKSDPMSLKPSSLLSLKPKISKVTKPDIQTAQSAISCQA
jgi:hypothetical protein